MRPLPRFLSLISIASLFLLSCSTDRTPTAPGQTALVPSFEITAGPASWTSCEDGININREPHFTVNPPPLTLYDSIAELSSKCGDLDFDGRLRWFEVTYATWQPGESPYKYWWLRWRDLETGATLALDSLRRITLDSGVVDSARRVEMRLNQNADAVASVLLISDDGSYVLTDSAFLDHNWYALGHENIFVQHWRTVPAPVLDSVVRTGDLAVTLYWRNGVNREIDSTWVFRGSSPIKVLGHTVTSYTDTVPTSGTYVYSLKHVTWPLFVAWGSPGARPNSASSNDTSVFLGNYPPQAVFGVTCQQLPCTFADSSSDADGSIVSWLWTFGDGDSSTVQNPSHTYAEGGDYAVRLIVTDDESAKDTATGWARPLQLAITGPTWVKPKITCEWDAFLRGGSGGMTYSWRIGAQEVGTDDYLYWYVRTSFQLTLIGQAGDGQADTAAVTVTVSDKGASCVLKRG